MLRKYLLGFTLKFCVVHEIGMCILRDVGCRILQHDAHPAEYSWIIELVAIKLDTDREAAKHIYPPRLSK